MPTFQAVMMKVLSATEILQSVQHEKLVVIIANSISLAI